MRAPPADDYYARLGVARTASIAELRRAYRVLALRWHPDRAGPDATELFQRISEAYQVLADAERRARYDRRLDGAAGPAPEGPGGWGFGGGGVPGGPGEQACSAYGGRVTWRSRSTPRRDRIDRLSAPLDELLARAVARRCGDGVVELLVTTAEAAAGGVAAIATPLPVACPTCTGVAAAHRVWCRRCEYAGEVVDDVLLLVEIPPGVSDGASYAFRPEGAAATAPFRVRLRVG
jgi:molecular chaperone DnaJ